MVSALSDLHHRQLICSTAVFIPKAAGTLLSPTSPLTLTTLERLLLRHGNTPRLRAAPLQCCPDTLPPTHHPRLHFGPCGGQSPACFDGKRAPMHANTMAKGSAGLTTPKGGLAA